MIRELVLVAGDLAAAPWFVGGAPPVPPIPAGLTIERLLTHARASLFDEGPVRAAQAAERLADGDTCLVAVTAGGAMAAEMWCSEKSRFIDWIGCNIRPPKGHVHVYNSWVQPEFRGLGLQWNLAAASCQDIVARGLSKMCAGVERKEYPPFARKYAAMGLGLMLPYRSIWSLQLLGVTAAAIPWSPPRALDEASRNAAKMLARRATRADRTGRGENGQRDGRP
jgi:hypothetical protein